MAAVLFRGSKILSIGHNRVSSNRKAYWGVSIHAELDAILKYKGDPSGLKMMVYRFRRGEHTLACSQPCNFCYDVMREAGIKYAIFVDKNNHLIKENIKGANNPHYNDIQERCNADCVFG